MAVIKQTDGTLGPIILPPRAKHAVNELLQKSEENRHNNNEGEETLSKPVTDIHGEKQMTNEAQSINTENQVQEKMAEAKGKAPPQATTIQTPPNTVNVEELERYNNALKAQAEADYIRRRMEWEAEDRKFSTRAKRFLEKTATAGLFVGTVAAVHAIINSGDGTTVPTDV